MTTIPWLKVLGKFRIVPSPEDDASIGAIRTITDIKAIQIRAPSTEIVPGYRITVVPTFPNMANIDVSYNNRTDYAGAAINGKYYELIGVSGGGTRRGRKMKRRTIRAVRTMRKMKKMN